MDALGAASYGDAEIRRFMNSRDVVMEMFNAKAEDVLGISASMVTTFTFNDTIVIVLRTGDQEPQLKQVSDFFTIMRKFMVDSLQHGILFRGAVAIGTFHVNEQTNTVMGQAVTDAAAWYNKAEWMGLHATPRATLVIDRCLEHDHVTKGNVMLDYGVPLKDGATVRAKVVNWPKVFFVNSIRPCDSDDEAKEKFLEFLSVHPVPLGTEKKYFNTVDFFDFAVNKIKDQEKGPTSGSSVRSARGGPRVR
jgi:hypothetical protein